ncbi:MAG: diaminopimelate decarboxylase [Clostridia bacterium]|nr:diaminopimelate decarboxylase [Clostridia bacterium]
MLCENVSVSADGQHLQFAGIDTVALAGQYGTPLYLMDEDRIRACCRAYKAAVSAAFDGNAQVLYASKASSFKRIYEIMREENMGVDVVSIGEIYTAIKAGFPMSQTYFHSNNKTDADIAFAMEHGIGYFVVDNEEELFAVEREAAKRGIRQSVLLRITPGIDPHTFEAVSTGKVDSKFGFAIETGAAEDILVKALAQPHIHVAGVHCHVGSQVFDAEVFLLTADVMLQFIADMKAHHGFVTELFDIGGGFGVRYLDSDPVLDLNGCLAEIGRFMKQKAAALGIALPKIAFEPGRSIVADAGMTLYTVGNVKAIPDFINYVSVDGGMTDNVRYAMYQAPYTLFQANAMNREHDMTCTVVGRCCESGDVIQPNIKLPSTIARGDIVACLTTGAYHYSMASNYNRLTRPPIVMLANGESYVAVRRETIDDLTALDM